MRVITGSARGRKLKELPGLDTRPTTDRVKEALFDIIQFEVPGMRVLDLFAGTGQLGIEALSRGAQSAVFVDQRKDAVSVIRDNLASTGFAGQGKVVQGESLSFLASCREKFDLILLDPPYLSGLLEKALEKAVLIDILAKNGIIVCESPLEEELPALPEPYIRGKSYRYGKIKLTLYRRDG